VSQQLNLFNPVFLRQKKYFSAVTMAQCLGIVLVALIAMYGFQRWQLAGLESQFVEAEAQFKTVQQQLTDFSAAKRNPSKALEDEATRLAAQVKTQEALLTRLDSDELGNAEGFSRYLNALARQTVAGVWITGFTATGTEGPLMIRGRLLQPELLPTYLRLLNREESLRGHGFAELQLITHEEKAQTASGEVAAARYVEFTLGATKPANRGRP
jgi:hypothetical protein